MAESDCFNEIFDYLNFDLFVSHVISTTLFWSSLIAVIALAASGAVAHAAVVAVTVAVGSAFWCAVSVVCRSCFGACG